MVTTKGTGQSISNHSSGTIATNLRLFRIDCLNGGPTLSTIPEDMYWKQDIKKRVVFSEFLIFDFCVSSCGGMNLYLLAKNVCL